MMIALPSSAPPLSSRPLAGGKGNSSIFCRGPAGGPLGRGGGAPGLFPPPLCTSALSARGPWRWWPRRRSLCRGHRAPAVLPRGSRRSPRRGPSSTPPTRALYPRPWPAPCARALPAACTSGRCRCYPNPRWPPLPCLRPCRLRSCTLHLHLVVRILFQPGAGILGYTTSRVQDCGGVVALVRAEPVSRHREADGGDHLAPDIVDGSGHTAQPDQNLLMVVGAPPFSHTLELLGESVERGDGVGRQCGHPLVLEQRRDMLPLVVRQQDLADATTVRR